MRIRGKILALITVMALVAADFVLWSQVPLKHTRWWMLSDFKYNPLKESTVSVARSDDPEQTRPAPLTQRLDEAQVGDIVRRAVELAGGLDTLKGTSFHNIVIKPNIVEPAPNENGVNTDWRVVKALVLLLYEINPRFHISVAEASGGWARPGTPSAPQWSLSDGYKISGYQAMIEGLQNDPAYPDLDVSWVDMNYDQTFEVPVPEPRISLSQTTLALPKTIVEADFIIDAPVLKVHNTGITAGLKNYVGVLPGMVYGWSHDQGYNGNGRGLDHTANILQKNIVDLVRTAGCDFVVVDGIVGKEQSKYTSGISKRRNLIVAGSDVVSVDAICAKLMDINPEDVEHITLAGLAGLGQIDLKHIRVTGSTLEKSATKFIKATSQLADELINKSYPYYGQSNRVWLLRGPFFGSLITDYLGGESQAAPEAGRDGWSQPVYFFDNLIDPAGVIQDTTDCIYYAAACLNAVEDHSAQLWLGSSRNMEVRLNGSRVYNYSGGLRRHRLPNDVLSVNVKAGINRILVKLEQAGGICDFSLNVCEVQTDRNYAGNRLAGAGFMPDSVQSMLKGDYNADGALNITDAISLLIKIQGQPDESYDFNADGKVNVVDVISLIIYIRNGGGAL